MFYRSFGVFLIFFLVIGNLLGQCPDQAIFNNQEQIDSFKIKYPDCKNIEEIYISPSSDESDDIIDLTPLAQLDSVYHFGMGSCNKIQDAFISDHLKIGFITIQKCENLEHIDIIKNISSVGFINLIELPSLDLEYQYSIDTIRGIRLIDLDLVNLDIFSSIKHISSILQIYENPNLTDISAFSDFEFETIAIRENPMLNSCSIEPVCNLAADNIDELEIYHNGPDCSNLMDIVFQCFPNGQECIFTSLILESQEDVDRMNIIPDQCIDSIHSILIYSNTADSIVDISNLIRFKELDNLDIYFNKALTSLSGLDSITEVDNLDIVGNHKLTSLVGLTNLKTISESFYIRENLSLTSITSDQFILEQLGDLEIIDSPVDDLSALSNIERIKELKLTNTGLENMSWAMDVNSIETVEIVNNDLLEDITFTNPQLTIGNTQITKNSNLNIIDGLRFQDTVTHIDIRENPLTSFQNIGGPKVLTDFIRIENTELSELMAWEGKTSAKSLRISNNQSLENLEMLAGFNAISALTINRNSNLSSLGTSPLDITKINDLFIIENESLEDISVLDYDFTIDKIRIISNPLLTSCDILPICKEYKSIDPNVTLSGNGEKCNLIDLNFDCEFGNNAYGDIYVQSQADIDSIASLFPLMDSVYGDLFIDFGSNSNTADFSFFENIKFVRDELLIFYPKQLGVFELFENCRVGGLLLSGIETPTLSILNFADTLSRLSLTNIEGLTNLQGMENVTFVNNEIDIGNASLTSFDGLDSLQTINILHIDNCPKLNNIDALQDVTRINRLRLLNLPQFTQFELFDGMRLPGALSFIELPHLQNWPSFDPVNNTASLSVSRCDNITEIRLDSLETISQIVNFISNDNLELISFANLKDVSTNLITDNEKLTFLSFPNLETVDGEFSVSFNDFLPNLNEINPNLIASTLKIEDNASLEDCNTELICTNFQAGSEVVVFNNLGCQTLEEVTENCIVSTFDDEDLSGIKLYPNPVSQILYLEGDFDPESVQIFNTLGQNMDVKIQNHQMDMTMILAGYYYLRLKNQNAYKTFSIVKR